MTDHINGIYQINCNNYSKMYIGQTINFNKNTWQDWKQQPCKIKFSKIFIGKQSQ